MMPADRTVDAAEIVGHARVARPAPCYNSEAAIGKLVADVRAALPRAAAGRRWS